MIAPGTHRGDQAVYAGRRLVGFVRPSVGGAMAFGPDGDSLGAFSSVKAARDALTARATASREDRE